MDDIGNITVVCINGNDLEVRFLLKRFSFTFQRFSAILLNDIFFAIINLAFRIMTTEGKIIWMIIIIIIIIIIIKYMFYFITKLN